MGLEAVRKSIQEIDEEFLELLVERAGYVEEIAEYKKEHRVEVLQAHVWTKKMDALKQKAGAQNLNREKIKPIFDAIHQWSIGLQKD